MGITDKIIGSILMIAGVAIWSINYKIAMTISVIGQWIAELMNAPTEVGTGITIIICLLCIALFALVTIVGGFVAWVGYRFSKF